MEKLRIVGFGIAGATFAWTCYLNQVDFEVIDNEEESSSHVAAGLINPVVFKRLTKSWKVDQLMPFASDFYNQIEKILERKILSHKSILRVFASIEEENNWSALEGDGRFSEFLNPPKKIQNEYVHAPYGAGVVKTLGHLNTRDFLTLSKAFFLKEGYTFSSELKADKNAKTVYSEGSDVLNNPLFNYLPMRPTHGDVLIIHSKDLQIEDIVNKNMFILPLGNDCYKIGATYNWELKTKNPSEEGKQELLEKLAAFTSFKFEVINHEAGLRPTVSDRRPLLGEHPEQKGNYIFNGLGTKGVLIAPFYANQLLHHIVHESPLDEEVSISRHLKHYNA